MIAPTFNRETSCAREHSLKNGPPLITFDSHVGGRPNSSGPICASALECAALLKGVYRVNHRNLAAVYRRQALLDPFEQIDQLLMISCADLRERVITSLIGDPTQ
jgi:hypothetical protein